MIFNQDYIGQSGKSIISGSGKIKVVIRMVPQCTLVNITDILSMSIQNVVIVTFRVFHGDLSVLMLCAINRSARLIDRDARSMDLLLVQPSINCASIDRLRKHGLIALRDRQMVIYYYRSSMAID